jgi:hypothetical protein
VFAQAIRPKNDDIRAIARAGLRHAPLHDIAISQCPQPVI